MVGPRRVYCPHRYREAERNAKLETRQNCCSVAPNPPPKGISSQAMTILGMPPAGFRLVCRLIATQQPDNALHLTFSAKWSLWSYKGVQALNDKSCELEHVPVCGCACMGHASVCLCAHWRARCVCACACLCGRVCTHGRARVCLCARAGRAVAVCVGPRLREREREIYTSQPYRLMQALPGHPLGLCSRSVD